jgi:hypothetical protein
VARVLEQFDIAQCGTEAPRIHRSAAAAVALLIVVVCWYCCSPCVGVYDVFQQMKGSYVVVSAVMDAWGCVKGKETQQRVLGLDTWWQQRVHVT